MLELLNAIDVKLFLFLNVTIANPVFDFIMPIITNKYTWVPIWLAVIIGLLWKGGTKGRWVVLLAIITVSCADLVAYRVMKKNIKRIRPCNAIEQVHLTVKRTNSYSMPSNHATNFFALATIFSFFYRRYRIGLYTAAAVVAFSRISVGVHYPFDTLVGALLGSAIAGLIILLFNKTLNKRVAII